MMTLVAVLLCSAELTYNELGCGTVSGSRVGT